MQHDIISVCQRARIIGLYGFIIFLPCSIAFTQICLSLLALTYLVEAALTKHFYFPYTPLNRPLFGYLAATLIATIFSPYILRSIKGMEGLPVITVFYLFYFYIKDVPRLKKIILLLLLSVTLSASYGVIQHYLEVDMFRLNRPISFLKHIDDDLTAPVRVPGFFSSYMTFSGQLAMAIPIICALLLGIKNRYKKMLLAISIILALLALLWTYTRSAWVGTICALTFFGYVWGRRRHSLFFLLPVILLVFLLSVILLGVIIFQPEVIDRSLSIFSAKDNIERLYTWESTLFMIKDYPLTGIGKGNYSRLVPGYREGYNFEFSSRANAHNNILQITVEGGIPSLFFFLWLWGVIFKELYRTYQQIPETHTTLKALSMGFLGSIIAFFIQGFFECNFGDSESAMMMWLIVALSLKLQHLTSTQE
jgi:hypothetical protein